MKLCKDIKLLLYSYFTLEETLTYFKDNIVLRNKLIKLNFKVLPCINDVAQNGELETVRYLISLGIKTGKCTLDVGSQSGNLELIKYFISFGIKPDKKLLDAESQSGNPQIFEYLKSILN